MKVYGSILGNSGVFGLFFGSILGGPIINRGRRRAIFILGILVLIGSGVSLIKTIPTIFIGRFICGFTGGVYTMICSKAIFE